MKATMKLPVMGSILLFNGVTVHADTKSEYITRLLSNAAPSVSNKHLRRLDETDQQEDAFSASISTYSVNFAQCQSTFTTTDNTVNSTTVLFRLCPDASDGCSSCVNDYYGEYIIDLTTYIEATTEYFKAYHNAMCQTCRQTCQQVEFEEEDGDISTASIETTNGGRQRSLGRNKFYNLVPNCTVCMDECDKVDNMEMDGYVDATNYTQCTKINDNTDEGTALYAGPLCPQSGTKIAIGVYSDEDCTLLEETKEADGFVTVNGNQMMLSNFFLQRSYDETCISCMEPEEQNDSTEQEDADEVTEMCEQIYKKATDKCEPGNDDVSNDDRHTSLIGDYNNEEDDTCQYIESLRLNSTDATKSLTNNPAAIPDTSATEHPTIAPINEPFEQLPLLRVETSSAKQCDLCGRNLITFVSFWTIFVVLPATVPFVIY